MPMKITLMVMAVMKPLATVHSGVLLIAVAAGIAYDAMLRLQNPEAMLEPALFTLLIAAISIISKEVLYHATRVVAKRSARHYWRPMPGIIAVMRYHPSLYLSASAAPILATPCSMPSLP